jgi:hypothetical protein
LLNQVIDIDEIRCGIENLVDKMLIFPQRLLGLFAHQRRSDVRCDSFHEFNRIAGEASFAPVVELDQTDNPIMIPNGRQGKGGIALMDALVAGMKPGIITGRDVQKWE